jgi:hypothetical protein
MTAKADKNEPITNMIAIMYMLDDFFSVLSSVIII